MKRKSWKSIILFVLLITLLALPALAAQPQPTPENQAPTAQDLELTTYRGVGLAGILTAQDPEDDVFEFQIVRSPRKGDLELEQMSGNFTYTPFEGERGRDSFTYVAIDARGNISPEATVSIRIERQSRQVHYEDMRGHPSHFAAVYLAERDIFVGEQIGGRHFFNPSAPLSRGEFLAMAMRLTNTDLLTGIVRTGFADDEKIGDWLKPYVSTALFDGLIQGIQRADGNIVFDPEAHISVSEAALILNNVLGLSDAPTAGNIMELAAPAWAHQATVNLRAYNIISFGYPAVYLDALTRADAADMLLGAANVLDTRNPAGTSLLIWAI